MMNEITRHWFRFRIPSVKMGTGQLPANKSHAEREDREAPAEKPLTAKIAKNCRQARKEKNAKSQLESN
jgi:hypothetical protein